jgi:hypothetical protein
MGAPFCDHFEHRGASAWRAFAGARHARGNNKGVVVPKGVVPFERTFQDLVPLRRLCKGDGEPKSPNCEGFRLRVA